MGLDVTPSGVHALAEQVATVADSVRRMGFDFGSSPAADGFEVDAVLGRVDAHLLEQLTTLSGNVTTLAEAMHASAGSIQDIEARNTDAVQRFNWGDGDGA